MEKIEVKKVNEILSNLKQFDYLAQNDDYISITEWPNGEGYNITTNNKCFSLTHGELDAINYLTNKIQYEDF